MERNYREVAQQGAWAKQWDFNSPRCQAKYSRAELARLLEDANEGLDFSGPEQYLITMNGDTATVVRKSADGKGQINPKTWTFINGAWRFDNC